jgi:hypothetical protein
VQGYYVVVEVSDSDAVAVAAAVVADAAQEQDSAFAAVAYVPVVVDVVAQAPGYRQDDYCVVVYYYQDYQVC